jgi:transposase InsO family protein
VVPGDDPNHAALQAGARALIVRSTLDGGKTPKEAATYWRKRIQSAFATSGVDHIHGFPREIFRRWLKLTTRTVRGWRAEVRAAQEQAILRGQPTPPLVEILKSNHSPSRALSIRQKRTPALEATVRDRFLKPSAPHATTVRLQVQQALSIEVSDRTVQRICQEIDDTERIKARGGPAGSSVILDKRYLRQAQVPNGVWTIDNSWIGKELLDPDIVLPPDEDFFFEAAIEELYEHGYTGRRRVEQLYMSVVMDACTGLHLATRLWDRPVNTRTTLLSLFDAVLRYGLPDVLYSDNGSEFKNNTIAAVLNKAEIHQRFSRPYYPEARGRIERTFRTIKEQVLPFLPGYRGHDYALPPTDLQALVPLAELERELQHQVELLINQACRRGMPVTRRQHYEDQVGARQFRRPGETPTQLAIPLLFQANDVVVDETGLRANGKLYTADELEMVPTGSRVKLYADPYRDTGYCVVLDSKGDQRSAFTVEAYGPGNPPPPIGVQHKNAAAARRRMEKLAEQTRKKAAKVQAIADAKAAGDVVAAELADAIEGPDWEIVSTDGRDDTDGQVVEPEPRDAEVSNPGHESGGGGEKSTALARRQEKPTRRRISDEDVTYNPLG